MHEVSPISIIIYYFQLQRETLYRAGIGEHFILENRAIFATSHTLPPRKMTIKFVSAPHSRRPAQTPPATPKVHPKNAAKLFLLDTLYTHSSPCIRLHCQNKGNLRFGVFETPPLTYMLGQVKVMQFAFHVLRKPAGACRWSIELSDFSSIGCRFRN